MKAWPRAKCCLKSGEAAAQRVAARIDDLRVRQDQVDQADVREVVRHLVDEERPAVLALDARALEVLLAERAQARRRPASRDARDSAGVARLRRAAAARARCAMMSGSSIVPSTCEWLARICSISVEPARGRPTMKIGSGASQPAPVRARRRTPRVNSLDRARATSRVDLVGVVVDACAAQGVAAARSARTRPRSRARSSSALPSAKSRCKRSSSARSRGRAARCIARRRRRRSGTVLRLARLHQASPRCGASARLLR